MPFRLTVSVSVTASTLVLRGLTEKLENSKVLSEKERVAALASGVRSSVPIAPLPITPKLVITKDFIDFLTVSMETKSF
jgi:hypothetical protein